ncbi:AraC-like DNA-binding protein [Pedobacter sp. AK017]|uniref:helix-turn-helix domain-containing protein n=1 Tax=Pedobacter sp. AK017 TaxID=2723073 RepID=UPI0016076B68|nr:helix-turn-helix domain-containing protein [Pedobacter sp. AK017]MBB5440241.1 AraC-like DNA-binding protein [Pedobacter sp. AK017]
MFSKPLYDENIEATLRQAYISPQVVLQRLEALIEEHYKDRKDPLFYSDALGYGLRSLNDLCRLHEGTTVFGLVQARILLEAKRLAVSTAMPVKLIAYELGFNNPIYFCRFFKKETGVTLGGWRKDYSKI